MCVVEDLHVVCPKADSSWRNVTRRNKVSSMLKIYFLLLLLTIEDPYDFDQFTKREHLQMSSRGRAVIRQSVGVAMRRSQREKVANRWELGPCGQREQAENIAIDITGGHRDDRVNGGSRLPDDKAGHSSQERGDAHRDRGQHLCASASDLQPMQPHAVASTGNLQHMQPDADADVQRLVHSNHTAVAAMVRTLSESPVEGVLAKLFIALENNAALVSKLGFPTIADDSVSNQQADIGPATAPLSSRGLLDARRPPPSDEAPPLNIRSEIDEIVDLLSA